MANQLFYACNPKATGLAAEHIYATYEYWDSCSKEEHLAKYYNMRRKKYVYLNGKDVTDSLGEPVPLGIDNTPFPTMIRCWLPHVRLVPYY